MLGLNYEKSFRDHNPWLIDESFMKDKEFILEAVKEEPASMVYADDSLREDKDFILTAIKKNGHVLYYIDDSLKKG